MPKLTFFNLGNADTCRIDLDNGKKILVDYANTRPPNNRLALECDLPLELRRDLNSADKDGFDVVAFTHLDRDHVQGASEFFEFQHAARYQGGDRVKIETLWVPAAVILEDSLNDDARIIRQEARYRLKQGQGIRVFSKPALLEAWLNKEGLTLDSRRNLITDAGTLAPDFDLATDGVEFFIHSPFASHMNKREIVARNNDSLSFQARFNVGGTVTDVLLTGDIAYEVIADIVNITKLKGNEGRLRWHVMGIPHHSSYKSLGPDKGKDKTVPLAEVDWLYTEAQAQDKGVLVSTSWPIPTDDSDNQPPHRQAAAYYREKAAAIGGQYLVTMEHPTRHQPKPLVITIDQFGTTVQKPATGGAGAIPVTPAPRAGSDR
ncbi:hypothetical protein Q0M94_26010 (plasmid) [Deinococcus radiomollis]|uniref:hypothetical protein n=1 Tax=Deinococcus radiomollis TaxID=468916 RepID=UPI0038917A7D